MFSNVNINVYIFLEYPTKGLHNQAHSFTDSSALATPERSAELLEVLSARKQSTHQKIPLVGLHLWMHWFLAQVKVLWTKLSVLLSESLPCSPRQAPTLYLQSSSPLPLLFCPKTLELVSQLDNLVSKLDNPSTQHLRLQFYPNTWYKK